VADNLTDVVENQMLNTLVGQSGGYTVTAPIKLALVTSNGNDATGGTEVTGGSYARQNIAFDPASGGQIVSTGTITFGNMPTCTVVGIELWDSNGTPKRIAYGPLSASKALVAGDTLQFAAASVTLTLG
jgi:hypothetical protein